MVRTCRDEQCTLLISGNSPASGEMSKKMAKKIMCFYSDKVHIIYSLRPQGL